MLLPSAVLAYREEQQADCDKLRERHRNAGNEYQQGDIPVPRAPELENPAENGAVRLAQQSADVHHGQQVRGNVKDHTCNQPGERHLGAERRAMLDATLAARTARIHPERYAGHCKTAGLATDQAEFECLLQRRHVLTVGAINHQDAGSQRPSNARTVVKAAIAQMPAPAVMGTQFASFTIATKAPSKKTSVMLQGRIRWSSLMIGPKPGGRCPARANSSTQKRSDICTAGMRKVVNASPKAATEIQPCCNERTANQILALVSIPAISMLKMGVRLAIAKKIAAAQTSANPLSTFAPKYRARTASQRRQRATSPGRKGIARYTVSQSRQISIVFTAAAPIGPSLKVLADHFENVTGLSMHDGFDRIHGHPINGFGCRERRHHEFHRFDLDVEQGGPGLAEPLGDGAFEFFRLADGPTP